MDLRMTIKDTRSGTVYDVSEVVGNMRITTHIFDSPGTCEFEILKVNDLNFFEGAVVEVVLEGHNIFRGIVFKKSRDKNVDIIKVTCYDQMRYLQYKDSAYIENMTSDQIFSMLCNRFVLPNRVVDASTHICAPRDNPATSLYDMMRTALNDTFVNTNQWFFIRDNFGTLEHINIISAYSGYVLGDASGVTNFSYETSIDKDVYNTIKLYRDNQDTGKREVFEVNSTVVGGDTLRWWGILQLVEKIDDTYNLQQIEERARMMLNYYNSTRRTLRLNCIGIPSLFAGSTVKVTIKDLGDLSLDSYMLITSCTHNIKNKEHTMELETEVVRIV